MLKAFEFAHRADVKVAVEDRKTRNSLFFSLLAGNLEAETGSTVTASAATTLNYAGLRGGALYYEQRSLFAVSLPPSTANGSGRIDHFLVFHGQLHLFKIEVSLSLKDTNMCPIGVRREIVLRYEPVTYTDAQGTQDEIRERRTVYFVFDDLIVPFTGTLRLSYPYFDYWEIPWPFEAEEENTLSELVLTFNNGKLAV